MKRTSSVANNEDIEFTKAIDLFPDLTVFNLPKYLLMSKKSEYKKDLSKI